MSRYSYSRLNACFRTPTSYQKEPEIILPINSISSTKPKQIIPTKVIQPIRKHKDPAHRMKKLARHSKFILIK